MFKRILFFFALFLVSCDDITVTAPKGSSYTPFAENVADSFKDKKSDVWVNGMGEVVRLLADDLKGSKHQRFILKVGSKQTILIAHNIDLAPRINSLKVGDDIEFYGEYEWNNKGGVVHWTHHDPKGKRDGGWLKHHGTVYK